MFSRRTSWSTAPNRLASRLAQFRREGAKLFDLTESNPTRCGFIYDDQAIREALGSADALEYDPNPRGLRSAREAVAGYYEERGQPIPTDRIFLTTSSSEAYSMCFRLLCDPGDEVLIPAPSYPLFDFLADLDSVKLKRYPLRYDHGWSIDLEALKSLITDRTRAILVVTPNNPTGSLLSREDSDRLVRLAMKHDLALIADEVFLDYVWAESTTPQSLDSRGLCLTLAISGLSKISALPQMKLGWITVRGPVGPDAEASGRLEVIADTYLSVATPTQVAARTLLEQRKLVQPQLLDRVAANLRFLDSKLGGASPVTRLQAEAGWYAILRAPSSLSDEDWALFLLETASVSVHPGFLFDFESGGHLVVSLIPRETEFQEGVERLVEAID